MDAEALMLELDGASVDSQLKTLEKLRKVAKQGDESRTEICDVGGLDRLKTLMKDAMDERVKERIIILLVYLGKAEANRDIMRESGMLDILLRELKSTNKVILHNAMAALVNVTIGNSANQNSVREAGALATIVGLMQSDQPKTSQNACWLLKKLATSNAKNCDAMRELGVLSSVVPLLATTQPVEVAEHAAGLLAFMLDKHTRNRATFKDVAGGPHAVVRLYEHVTGSHSKTEEYCTACIDSLGGMKRIKSDDSPGNSATTGVSQDERYSSRSTNSSAPHSKAKVASHGDSSEPMAVPAARVKDKLAVEPSKSAGSARSPRKGDASPRKSDAAGSAKSPRGLFGFAKKGSAASAAKTGSSSVGSGTGNWTQSMKGDHEPDPMILGGGGGRRSFNEEEGEG